MAFEHKNKKGQTYFLHTRNITLKGSGKEQTIYFFSRDQKGSLEGVPDGYKVIELPNGLPVLKKK